MKQLYFLHIPKTAGQSLRYLVKKELDLHKLDSYISNQYPHSVNFKNIVFLSSHMGTYPIEKNINFDTCTIVRNPIEARASYFNFIYGKYLKDREEYVNIKKYLDKFKYYLFEDKNFLSHNNYQSRFLCNPMSEKAFDVVKFYDIYSKEMMNRYKDGLAFDWFVQNDNTTLDNAIKAIDSLVFANTLENFNIFVHSVSNWFDINYNIKIRHEEDVKINTSVTEYDGVTYRTSDLVNSLSDDEKKMLLDLNNIDYYIYNYVKGEYNEK